jgi:hypothetical protein
MIGTLTSVLSHVHHLDPIQIEIDMGRWVIQNRSRVLITANPLWTAGVPIAVIGTGLNSTCSMVAASWYPT